MPILRSMALVSGLAVGGGLPSHSAAFESMAGSLRELAAEIRAEKRPRYW
jgi:hypothetical protein